MNSPYEGLPSRAFWRTGVAEQTPETVRDLYIRKFEIPPTARVATGGSCFAQHIAREMRARGYPVIDVEPPPAGLDPAVAKAHGYLLYSARYGNIYTARQLLQLIQEARGQFEPQDWIWERGGRFFDALRPGVEPAGLDSADEVRAHRAQHLAAIRRMLRTTDVFVFTLGLTETWVDKASGTVFPTAPGTIAGHFDPDRHAFLNLGFGDTFGDMVRVRRMLKKINPAMRFLLTVSPVPLTATASDAHVLAATVYSKSVLRAVAGEMQARFEDVDYFPSYEIIASHFSRGAFFEDNLRSVADAGVQTVMRCFFSQHGTAAAAGRTRPEAAKPQTDEAAQPKAEEAAPPKADDEDDVVCEEALLDAFAR